ncbi:MAG: hypothetical protein AAGL68_00225 [Pseudomonadota bacterium]
MEIDARLLQFGGSLIAILVLAWLALALRLGPRPKLVGHHDAAQAAGEVQDGFAAVESAVAADGSAAVLRDPVGKIMVLKEHGTHFAGRVLTASARASIEGNTLSIDSGERRFGAVTLNIEAPQAWADAINRLGKR